MMRLTLAALFVAAPILAGSVMAGSDQPTPAAVNTQQRTPAPAATPQSTPADSGYSYGDEGGCPFGHKKQKTAATS